MGKAGSVTGTWSLVLFGFSLTFTGLLGPPGHSFPFGHLELPSGLDYVAVLGLIV